jgi:hypothetical protein
MITTDVPTVAVEVWLTRGPISIKSQIVHEGERTEQVATRCLSMRGAQREVTAALIGLGYMPVGRWVVEATDWRGSAETSRTFRTRT